MRPPLKTVTLLAIGMSVAGALSPGALGSADLSARQVDRTIASWREHVGHGRQLGVERRKALEQEAVFSAEAVASASRARLTFRSLRVSGGSQGTAVYLDLATDAPARFLRHGRRLVLTLSGGRFPGGWAIRLRDRAGGTVGIAGFGGNEGFVWSRSDLDAISPVAHW